MRRARVTGGRLAREQVKEGTHIDYSIRPISMVALCKYIDIDTIQLSIGVDKISLDTVSPVMSVDSERLVDRQN